MPKGTLPKKTITNFISKAHEKYSSKKSRPQFTALKTTNWLLKRLPIPEAKKRAAELSERNRLRITTAILRARKGEGVPIKSALRMIDEMWAELDLELKAKGLKEKDSIEIKKVRVELAENQFNLLEMDKASKKDSTAPKAVNIPDRFLKMALSLNRGRLHRILGESNYRQYCEEIDAFTNFRPE